MAYMSFGEGDYAQTDAAVAQLLKVRTAALPATTPVPNNTTPELYAGSGRASSPTTRRTGRSAHRSGTRIPAHPRARTRSR